MRRLGGAMVSGVAGSAGFAGGPKPGVLALPPIDQRISQSGERLVEATRTIRHHNSIGQRRRRGRLRRTQSHQALKSHSHQLSHNSIWPNPGYEL
jgi:hypothetical protein